MPGEAGEECCHLCPDLGRFGSKLPERRFEPMPRLHRLSPEGLSETDIVIAGDTHAPPCLDKPLDADHDRRSGRSPVDEIPHEYEQAPLRMRPGRIDRMAETLHEGDQFSVAAMDVADDVERGRHGGGRHGGGKAAGRETSWGGGRHLTPAGSRLPRLGRRRGAWSRETRFSAPLSPSANYVLPNRSECG